MKRLPSEGELAKWLDDLPANLKARVNNCAFRYGIAREMLKAKRNNEALRQLVDAKRVALNHALDAAFAWKREDEKEPKLAGPIYFPQKLLDRDASVKEDS